MPTITVRVSSQERGELQQEARVRGSTVSEVVRSAWRERSVDTDSRLESLESRVGRLERMAGLE